jgi:N-acetylneuraminic acid mutarotase
VRRRRLVAGIAVLLAVGLIVLIGRSGSSRQAASSPGQNRSGATGGPREEVKLVAVAVGRLPTPVQDAAIAAVGPNRVLLIGGLDQSEASLTDILDVSGSGASRTGALSTATHDASASVLGEQAYLFGGGALTSFSAIVRISSNGTTQPAGQLPTPASDLATAVISGTVYIVGGYTGQAPLRTILAWRPGGAPARVVGLLPKPLRYAAVAEQGGQLLIAGGTSGVEASRDVYRFDPRTGAVTTFAHLPHPVTHAVAVALNGIVFVLGGRGASADSQTGRILAISPGGAVSTAGTLPEPLSDVSAVALGGDILLAGGRGTGGHLHDAILMLSARSG